MRNRWLHGCWLWLAAYVSHAQPVVTCLPSEDINDCIDKLPAGVIRLVSGDYYTEGVKLKSNITLEVPSGALVKLKDSAKLNSRAFGGVANAVIQAKGSRAKPLTNINLLVDGEIDGNKLKHPYENGGVEGVNLVWVSHSTIDGSGIIHSANGDGIDLDAVSNVLVRGVTVKNNGGTGVHFGSPRPIYGSKNNVLFRVTSTNNGFRAKRNGFDISWPNPYGATLISCVAKDNYRNYQIEAKGGVVVNFRSQDSGGVIEADDFSGASYAFIGG